MSDFDHICLIFRTMENKDWSLPEKSSAKRLKYLIQCPVCWEYMTDKINLCVSGHSICFSCTTRITACPLCRKQVSPWSRNYFAEGIIGESTFSCKFSKNGCPAVLEGHEYNIHTKYCKFGQ